MHNIESEHALDISSTNRHSAWISNAWQTIRIRGECKQTTYTLTEQQKKRNNHKTITRDRMDWVWSIRREKYLWERKTDRQQERTYEPHKHTYISYCVMYWKHVLQIGWPCEFYSRKIVVSKSNEHSAKHAVWWTGTSFDCLPQNCNHFYTWMSLCVVHALSCFSTLLCPSLHFFTIYNLFENTTCTELQSSVFRCRTVFR